MDIILRNKTYQYVSDYREDAPLRKSFNALTKKVYHFDFETWYQDGYWGESYVPHSLLYKQNVVANVSVSVLDFIVLGEKKRYLQIGTVMTHPRFRGLGLSRFLMERVMAEWQGNCDMIYLFANDSVLDFYPKFGFVKAEEYQLSKSIEPSSHPGTAVKVDMSKAENRRLLIDAMQKTTNRFDIHLENNIGLLMFYCTSVMSESVWHLPALGAYAVAEQQGDTLLLHDLYCDYAVDVDDVITALVGVDTRRVVLQFTLSEHAGFEQKLHHEENSTLFLHGTDAERFAKQQILFPSLSRT